MLLYLFVQKYRETRKMKDTVTPLRSCIWGYVDNLYAPLGEGRGDSEYKQGVSALCLPERSRPQGASGERRGPGLSARTSSRASVPQLWVLPSELLEILEASVRRGQAFRGFHSALRWLLA